MIIKRAKTIILTGLIIFSFSIIPGFAGEIHHLAKIGDAKKMKTLLEQDPGLVNSKDAYGWTPLQIAALMGHKPVVKLLIETGANLDEADGFGFTALHLAAIRGNNEIYKLLMKNGAKIKDRDKDKDAAAGEGPADVFSAADVRKELTDALVDDKKLAKNLKAKKHTNTNPYVFVMMSLKQELIEVNLARSSKKGKEELSLTSEAIQRLKELAEAFISRRRDTKAKGEMGNTLLHIAVQQGESKKINRILKNRPGWVNSANIFGITPLHYAAIAGDREIAARLIESGARVNARTKTGITPLYGAVSQGKSQMVGFLISKGAKVNEPTHDGAVPLHAAVTKQVAEMLVAAGARVNIKNKYGFTPLHIAAHYGHVDVAEYLLSRGVALESRTDAGWTPLCEAVFGKKKTMVAFLISKGANVNARTNSGATPLEIAVNFRYNNIAQILKQNGAF
ncbi:MAG: ankyrin repeat domain-containing protein [Candidatus Aminicenantes bacterium]|nr:MAG: ankyrin repeat domain-containing protein [Candidatus Aminicenantes bacterium]